MLVKNCYVFPTDIISTRFLFNVEYLSEFVEWQQGQSPFLNRFGKCDIFPIEVTCRMKLGHGSGGNSNTKWPLCIFDRGRNHRVSKWPCCAETPSTNSQLINISGCSICLYHLSDAAYLCDDGTFSVQTSLLGVSMHSKVTSKKITLFINNW